MSAASNLQEGRSFSASVVEWHRRAPRGTLPVPLGCHRTVGACRPIMWREVMGRGLLLWLIGIPLPIILVVWLFGGLH
jgi:hypothetical protein